MNNNSNNSNTTVKDDSNLVNNNNNNTSILTRVHVAQSKIYGLNVQQNIKEGFRELYSLREYKESYYPLGCYYHDQQLNDKQALYWFKKCIHNPMSKYRIAIIYQRYNKLEKSLLYMSESAYLGNKYAQFMLGVYYHHGILVKQSIIDSKTWYERSANQEFAEAQTALANLLLLQQQQDNIMNGHHSSNKSRLVKKHGSNNLNSIYLKKDTTADIDIALHWLYKAEYQGNASALIRLGSLHEEGMLVQRDNLKAIEYYKRAALVPLAPNHVLSIAHYLVGINYRLGDLGLEQDNLIAFHYLTRSANLGYAPAQRALGIMYAEGIGTSKNLEKSHTLFKTAAAHGDIRSLCLLADTTEGNTIELYTKAATLGSIRAQLSLAQHYQRIEQLADAFKWYEIASFSGTPITKNDNIFNVRNEQQRNTARLMVARYRYNGWGGVEKDALMAFQEFKTLFQHEFSDAYYWLAACYEEIEEDVDLAFQYYMKSAIAGDRDGQFQVAYMLSNGYINKEKQLIKDRQEAFFWYSKAADRGHCTAQYSLGLYYEHGICTKVNIDKAIDWYRAASTQNMTLAMVRLARLLDNIRESIHWLDKAISIGDVSALRELATFYKNGLIEEKEGDEMKKAFELYQQAANKDDPMSWHALSIFYEQGSATIPFNLDMAIHCLKKAEELGYSVAALDLAEMYYKNERIQDTVETYHRLVKENDLKSVIGWKARLALSKMIVFENQQSGITPSNQQQLRVYSWMINMQSKKRKYYKDDYPHIFEILGYCAEFGIGTPVDKKQSIKWYELCVAEEGDDWAIKRSLCRLVNHYMDKKDYKTAHRYLNRLKPDLDDMCKLSEDANKQACRMRYHLGYLYMYGIGIEKNADLAMDYFTDAADSGDIDATYELGKSLLVIDDEEAKHRFEEGAMEGHAGCMRELAILLLFEESDQCMLDDDPDDYDGGAEIVRLLELATELHDVEATYQLALIYENGLGTVLNRNVERSLPVYMKAAELGHEHSMVKTGEILGNVLGHHADAIYWFEKAIQKTNNIKAQVMLISYSFQGFMNSSVERQSDADNFQALRSVINQQADMMMEMERQQELITDKLSMNRDGLGLACYILGQCHELGRGTPMSMYTAKEWYARSIGISKNVEAMWRLGFIYHAVEGDELKALEWYRSAAEKGRHRESHYQLGLFHLNGLGGLEKNIIAAQKYFTKASDQGHSPATFELARLIWNRNHDYIYGYELYKLAGQMHVSGALRELGHLSHTGFSSGGVQIVNQDYKRAFAYYCEAAQMGDSVAALMVGNYFEEGYLADDLGQDCERALQWYESAYRLNGGGLAELAIGKLKHIMADTIIDPKEADDIREEAFVWFESAANNSMDPNQETFAKVMIALYYLNGWGRKTQDAKTGFEMLLNIARSSGSRLAFIAIARCYEEGIGTEYNIEKAVNYYDMAANMNDQGALIRVGEIYEQGLLFGKVDKEAAESYYNRANILDSNNSS